ncbi:MAG: ethanolamine ammonia-lyase [Sphingomonas bacterium]|nr:ethanolamine ammonia-lyase [Sphingomonas bacterium]
MADPPALRDRLRALTQARVLLGRAGQGLPTRALLDFQLDHARARDAVHAAFEPARVAAALGQKVIEVRSQAGDRHEYLRRPDLGRLLHPEDVASLAATGDTLAIIVADGLSATAVHAHAAPLVAALLARLAGWRIAPIVLAHQGRVALGDAIGAALGVELAVMLIGERPGLSAPDSLGAYLTWQPRPGRQDSERNCVSNIRPPHGLGYEAAADTIVQLLVAARRLRLTGVSLKPGADRAPPPLTS